MTPEEHDRALAATSHLPHLIAAALAARHAERVAPLGGDRLAAIRRGLPRATRNLWRADFCRQSRSEVLDALKRFEHRLANSARALRCGDDDRVLRILERAQGSETRFVMLWEIDIHPAVRA